MLQLVVDGLAGQTNTRQSPLLDNAIHSSCNYLGNDVMHGLENGCILQHDASALLPRLASSDMEGTSCY